MEVLPYGPVAPLRSSVFAVRRGGVDAEQGKSMSASVSIAVGFSRAAPRVPRVRGVDWQHLFGRFREGHPRLPELDRRHVAQRRVHPEVVVPVHVVREPGPELARRAERLAVDELGLQYPVGRLVDGAVAGEPLADGDLSMPKASSIGSISALSNSLPRSVRNTSMSEIGKEGVANAEFDRPGALPGPGGRADDLSCCVSANLKLTTFANASRRMR